MILEMSLSQTVQHWCKVICRSQIKTDFKKSIVAQSRLYSSICLMGWRKAWELQTRRRFEPPHYRGLDPHTRIHLNVKDCGENYNVAICLYLLSQGKQNLWMNGSVIYIIVTLYRYRCTAVGVCMLICV